MPEAAPETRTIKAVVEYDGTGYAGFQQQQNVQISKKECPHIHLDTHMQLIFLKLV